MLSAHEVLVLIILTARDGVTFCDELDVIKSSHRATCVAEFVFIADAHLYFAMIWQQTKKHATTINLTTISVLHTHTHADSILMENLHRPI